MGDPAGGGGAPGGGGTERKLVTVLAVDLDEPVEGFDERDPEDVRAMLAGHLDRVRAEVEGFGGSIEHAAAGRALAVFGVPRTHEDDAERAVRAALTIRDALAAAAPTLRVHLAVAGGEAVVRLDPQAAGQRVSGAPIGLCTRLLETVPAGGVLVAESSARVTEAAIAYGPSSSVALPGGRPVTVRPALDPRPPGLDLPARHATPLVGRASELDALLGQLARVRATHSPKLLVLVGPPGIGKSRLAGELARVAAEDQPETAAWRGGRSLPYGDGVTFSALAEIVRAEAGIREGDPPDRVLAKLTAAAGRAVPEPDIALWVAGHLRRLVSVDGLTEPGGADRAEAFAAWRRFLDGLAANRPLVLLVEDLHWADDALLDFLEALAAPRAGPATLLVLATARPELLERRPDWAASAAPAAGAAGNGGGVAVVPVGPLSDGDTTRLLELLLERHELPAGAAGRVAGRVGGNPLFVEEYVRMLHDHRFPARPGREHQRAAAGERAQDLAAAAPESMPVSVHAIIAARLDALPADEKAILQDAAVLGQVGWVGALSEIGGHERAGLEACLGRLEGKAFVYRAGRSRVAGEAEYAFHHILVRDVAYGQIPRARRADQHRRAAAWVEQLAPGRAEDRVELLVYHYQAALTLARAVGQETDELAGRTMTALRQAGDRAAALGVDATAARYYAQALELCPADDEGRPDLELLLGRARCLAEGGGGELLASARDALLARGDPVRAAEAEMHLAELAFLHGQGDLRAAHLARAQALVAEAPPSRSKAAVLKGCMLHLAIASRQGEALAVARDVLAMARQLGLRDLEGDALGTIGLARVERGERAGLADMERAIAILKQQSSPGVMVWHLNLAYASAALGDLGSFSAALAAGGEAAERFRSSRRQRSVALQRVAEHYWRGRWDEAVRVVDELVSSSRGGERHYLEWECRTWRGRIRLARGQLAWALEDAAAALDLAREAADPQSLNPTLAFRARALLAAGDAAGAAALADELLAGVSGSLLGPDLGVDLAVVLAELGHPPEALDTLEIPASPWLQAARAFLAGDPGRAAALYVAVGARPDEADARLAAARVLLAAGKVAEAEAELRAATAFWREVGASGRLHQADTLRSAASGDRHP
jgi:class 3 adenylate cyclase/tetratricopeptide (TPR) repeat protein